MILGTLEISRPQKPPRSLKSSKDIRQNEQTFQALPNKDFVIPGSFIKNVFNHSPAPLVIMRLENHSIVGVNDSFLNLLGYQRQELLGCSVHKLQQVSELRAFKQFEESLKRGQSIEPHEHHLLSKCGALKIVLLNAEPFDFFGETHVLLSFLDISSTKLTEERLNEALRAALEEVEPFVKLVMQKLAQVKTKVFSNDVEILTEREKEVLELIARGLNNASIAKTLDLATHTVRNYVTQIYQKLDLHSRAEAVVWARERGIIKGA